MENGSDYNISNVFGRFNNIKNNKDIRPYYVDALTSAMKQSKERLDQLPDRSIHFDDFDKDIANIQKKYFSKPFFYDKNYPELDGVAYEVYRFFDEYNHGFCSDVERLRELEVQAFELMPRILHQCRLFEAKKFKEQVFRLYLYCYINYGEPFIPPIFNANKLNELLTAIEFTGLEVHGLRYGGVHKPFHGKPGRPRRTVEEDRILLTFFEERREHNPNLSIAQIAVFYAKVHGGRPKTYQNRLTKLLKAKQLH